MGYLTPILFYNDSIHEIREDPTINDKLYSAAMFDGMTARSFGTHVSRRQLDISYTAFRKTWLDKVMGFFGWKRSRAPSRKQWRGGGSFAIGLPTQHADCDRVLVIRGNGWIDLTDALYRMDAYGDDDYFKSCLTVAERYVKELKKQLKEATSKKEEISK